MVVGVSAEVGRLPLLASAAEAAGALLLRHDGHEVDLLHVYRFTPTAAGSHSSGFSNSAGRISDNVGRPPHLTHPGLGDPILQLPFARRRYWPFFSPKGCSSVCRVVSAPPFLLSQRLCSVPAADQANKGVCALHDLKRPAQVTEPAEVVSASWRASSSVDSSHLVTRRM